MRLILIALAVLMAVALAGNRGDLPFAKDLYLVTDTMHVTTAEQGWLLGSNSGAYKLTIVNPNNTTLLFRFSNGAGVIQDFAGAYSTTIIEFPAAFPVPLDSIFIDGSANCTVYLHWWEVQ